MDVLFLAFADQVQPGEQATTYMLHVIAGAVVAGIAACFSSLDKDVKVRQMLYYTSFAAFLGGVIVFGWKSFFPNWAGLGCVPICGLAGFLIYGISVRLRKYDKSVENIDLSSILRKRLGIESDKKEGDGNAGS